MPRVLLHYLCIRTLAGAVGGVSRYAIKDWTLNPVNLFLGAANNALYEVTSILGFETGQAPFVEGIEGGLRSMVQMHGFQPNTWREEKAIKSPDLLKGVSHGIMSGIALEYAAEYIYPPVKDGVQYIFDNIDLSSLLGEEQSGVAVKCITQPIAITALKSFLTKGDPATAVMSALGQLSTCIIRSEAEIQAEEVLNASPELANDYDFLPLHNDA